MTETERKALALVNEVLAELEGNWAPRTKPFGHEAFKALCRAIEQHEAFRREVSDAVERAVDDCGHDGLRKAYIHSRFFHFILSKPVDPLVETMLKAWPQYADRMDACKRDADALRNALAARGLEIREVQP